MQFTITITGEGAELAKALQALKAATDGQNIVSGEVKAVIDTDKKAAASKQEKPKEEKPKQPEPESEKDVSEDADPIQKEADLGEVPTVVELRAKAQEKGTTAAAKKAIKALLDDLGHKSISDIPEEDRAAFMQALDAI